MPNVITSTLGALGSGARGLIGGVFGGLIPEAIGFAKDIFEDLGGQETLTALQPFLTPVIQSALRPNLALPGGAPIRQVQSREGPLPFDPRLTPTPFDDLSFAGPGTTGGGVATITPRTIVSRRLPSRVDVPIADASGNMRFVTFKNMGRPILWSGDLSACKRVRRAGSKARRAAGGR